MKGFYNVTKELKTALAAEPFVNTVTFGSLDDVDLNKQTIFPLSHIIVAETTDIFVGNDNEQDVLNTQLGLLTRIINILQRGDLYTNLYQVQGDVSCEPFVDRFENKLAGWSATFDVVVQNDMTICS